MNKSTISGYISGSAELVVDRDNEKFLTGTLCSEIQHEDFLEEVRIALIYDQAIAKIPYWELSDGDHVYLTGRSYQKNLPYLDGDECSVWFKVEAIEVQPAFNPTPRRITPMERTLMMSTEIFGVQGETE